MTSAVGTSMGAAVTVSGLRKTFGPVTAVADIDLHLPAGSFTALLGPSGCGKSTLLSLLAGLEPPDAGDLALDGRDITGLRAEDRPVGLVFQKPLLFPYLTVADNVAFGLRMRRIPRRRARAEAGELLESVGLGGLGGRRVGELSGGQEQRVALARALALRPRLLLLDEPFSQLDPQLRGRMRNLVRELAATEKTTTLFVTHDLAEAVDVADEIVLMLDGRIEGKGSPEMFYERPPSLAAARFFEAENEIPGHVTDGVFHSAALESPLRPIDSGPDGPAVLVVRPESLVIAAAGDPRALAVVVYPLGVQFAGTHRVVTARTRDGIDLLVHLPRGLPIDDAEPVRLVADAEACAVYPGPLR